MKRRVLSSLDSRCSYEFFPCPLSLIILCLEDQVRLMRRRRGKRAWQYKTFHFQNYFAVHWYQRSKEWNRKTLTVARDLFSFCSVSLLLDWMDWRSSSFLPSFISKVIFSHSLLSIVIFSLGVCEREEGQKVIITWTCKREKSARVCLQLLSMHCFHCECESTGFYLSVLWTRIPKRILYWFLRELYSFTFLYVIRYPDVMDTNWIEFRKNVLSPCINRSTLISCRKQKFSVSVWYIISKKYILHEHDSIDIELTICICVEFI